MRRLIAWMLLVSALLASPEGVEAQTRAQVAESRRLFEQGLAHAEAERWQEACASFEQALAITERPSILLNLATAEAETGALVESAESYRRFLQLATGRDQRQHRTEATEALAAVERRIPRLELDVSALLATDEIMVDERTLLSRDSLASGLMLNPGAHRVRVRRGGRFVIDERLELAEGDRRALALRVPDLRPARTVPEPVVAATESEPVSGGGDDGLAIGLGVGLGVGALVIGAVIAGVVVGTSSSPMNYQGNVGDGVIRF